MSHRFPDQSRRNSLDVGENSREAEFVVLKERKLVSLLPVFHGMSRFSFLLETCQPGSVPDSHLLAAALDLVSNLIEKYLNLVIHLIHIAKVYRLFCIILFLQFI